MVDMKAGIDEKHINRDRNMLMRKNSVRGAIRKSSRQNSMNKESTGTWNQENEKEMISMLFKTYWLRQCHYNGTKISYR